MGTKEDAIALYAGGYTYRQIERMPGMPSRMTLWRWVNGRHDGAPGAEADGRRTGMAKRGNGKPRLPRVVGDGPTYPDIDPEDKDALIERLQLENDILRGTQEVLKGRALGSSTNREKSELIEWLRANTARPLSELTASLRISRSSYEYWRTHLHDVGVREEIGDEVERVFREEGGCARGYRFVHEELRREGVRVSEKIVRDVMRGRGLLPAYRRRPRRYSSYAGETDEAPANIPLDEETGAHDFRAAAPNEKWVSDITEFRLPDAPKVYLSPIVDLFDSKPVAWSIGLHPDHLLADSSLLEGVRDAPAGRAPVLPHGPRLPLPLARLEANLRRARRRALDVEEGPLARQRRGGGLLRQAQERVLLRPGLARRRGRRVHGAPGRVDEVLQRGQAEGVQGERQDCLRYH